MRSIREEEEDETRLRGDRGRDRGPARKKELKRRGGRKGRRVVFDHYGVGFLLLAAAAAAAAAASSVVARSPSFAAAAAEWERWVAGVVVTAHSRPARLLHTCHP